MNEETNPIGGEPTEPDLTEREREMPDTSEAPEGAAAPTGSAPAASGEQTLPASGEKEGESEGEASNGESVPDYGSMAENDLREILTFAPECERFGHLSEMPGALRFAELREMGLSVREAYYAVSGDNQQKPPREKGGRAHLHSSVPGMASQIGCGMTGRELDEARRLFPGMNDRELASLFRRVSER